MNKTTLFLLSVILAGSVFAQTAAVPAAPVPIVVNGQQYVPAPAVPATPAAAVQAVAQAAVPQVAQQAAQAVARVMPNVNTENLGQTFGSTLGGVLQSFSDATGGAVNKTADLTGSVVDKSGDVLSRTSDKVGSLTGQALDRTFGKDKTVVEGLQDLGNTNVGKFAMVLAAWKVMGKDAVGLLNTVQGILIGVPLQIVIILLYVWVMRRFFITRSVVLKKTGGMFSKERVVEYGLVNVTSQYDNKGSAVIVSRIDEDTKHAGLFITSLVFLIVSVLNIAQVIF